MLLIFLAPRAWGNLAAHKEISRVWLLNFLQFCATLARLVDLLASLTRKKHIMAVQKQGTAMYQVSSFRLIAYELIMACLFMLRLLRS